MYINIHMQSGQVCFQQAVFWSQFNPCAVDWKLKLHQTLYSLAMICMSLNQI